MNQLGKAQYRQRVHHVVLGGVDDSTFAFTLLAYRKVIRRAQYRDR